MSKLNNFQLLIQFIPLKLESLQVKNLCSRFHRIGEYDNRSYWECAGYKKFRCKVRIISKQIDGCEKLKIKSTQQSGLYEML